MSVIAPVEGLTAKLLLRVEDAHAYETGEPSGSTAATVTMTVPMGETDESSINR